MNDEEFGVCDDTDCDGTAYYLVRDCEEAMEVRVCGLHLGTLKGEKQ